MRSTTIRAVGWAAAFWASTAVGAFSICATDRVDLRGDWGKVRFTVEVADDPAERSRGLMFRETMPRMSGMIFLYETPQPLAFWMRNTLIPLDLIFFDETGTVTHIHPNAIPLDETPIPGGPGQQLGAFEINGGMAERLGISVGSELRHPGIPQADAVWPCDGE